MTFYDRWLSLWDETVSEKAAARKVIHERELEWIETVQDARAALLIAPETGFRTMGTLTMVAEIPPGWHTGEHKHGEEVIRILTGTGFSVIDGVRYDWAPGDTLAVPFGARHQHFNLGEAMVRYFSVLSVHLENFAGLHRTSQHQPCGEGIEASVVRRSHDGLDDAGRRVHLAQPDVDGPLAPERVVSSGGGEGPTSDQELALLAGDTVDVGDIDGFHRLMHLHRDQSAVERVMRVGKDLNGFAVTEQEISGVLTDPAGQYSGKHAHQEALLYVLQGRGHTVIDGEAVPWEAGSALHVSGPQTFHQHFVEEGVDSRMLRVSSGLRYVFEPIVKTEWPYLFIAPRQAVAERAPVVAHERVTDQ